MLQLNRTSQPSDTHKLTVTELKADKGCVQPDKGAESATHQCQAAVL